MQLYGPRGLRQFIRFNLKMTQAHLSGRYAVHELLSANEAPSVGCETSDMHWNEAPGRDIRPNSDGLWSAFETASGFTMDAGPLSHRGTIVSLLSFQPPHDDHHSSTPGAFLPCQLLQSRVLGTSSARLTNPCSTRTTTCHISIVTQIVSVRNIISETLIPYFRS